jgi:putative PIN family toxin of toxin-antitoxin system
LLARWRAGEFELLISEALVAELAAALRRPKIQRRVTEDQAERLVDALRSAAQIVPDVPPMGARSRDPDDDYLLGLAQSAGAILVTGDKDLLAMRGLPIESPASFVRRLEARGL